MRGAGPLDERLELRVLLAKSAAIKGLAGDVFQVLQRKRLLQIVISAQLHRLDRRLDGALTGQQDHFALRVKLLEAPEQLQAADARHHHVENRDIEVSPRCQPQRLFAIPRRLHRESGPREPGDQRFPKLRIIVHYEQVDG